VKSSQALCISPASTDAAGYTAAAIGRSFGLSRVPTTPIVRTGNDAKQPG